MQSKFLSATLLAAFTLAAAAQTAPIRPKITGISHLAVYTSDAAAADHYYRQIVGAAKLPDPENAHGVRYAVSSTQFVDVLPLPPGSGINRLDHTAWITESAEGMRKYLAAHSWKTPAKVEKGADGSHTATIAIFDNPKNPGYPTYWHARGYGLFAVNPVAPSGFDPKQPALNFTVEKGQTVTFRYRIVLYSAAATTEQLNHEADAFAARYK